MKAGPFQVLKCSMPGVHGVEAHSAHSFPRHTHDQFGIGIIRSGAQKSLSGRGMVEAGPGMMITVNPGEVHDGAPIGEGGRRWSMLYFDPAAMREFADGLDPAGGDFEFRHPVLDRPDMVPRFEQLFLSLTGGDADPLAAEEAALLLFSLMVPVPPRDGRRPAPAVGRAQAMIDDDPTEAVSLVDLAAVIGASRFQTVRAFAHATGLTPHAYLVQRRVALARRLITEGMPLAEAATECGFFDQSHMNRHFTRIYGITPGAYALALR
jgi:AraC-like DNA-binding protein